MGAKRYSKEFFSELTRYIIIANKHFHLSPQEIDAVCCAANRSPVRAMACYRAIANSLKVTKQ